MSAMDESVVTPPMNDPSAPMEHEEKTSTTTEESAQPAAATPEAPSKDSTPSLPPTSDLVSVSATVLRGLQQKLQQCFEKLEAQIAEDPQAMTSTLREAREALDEANLSNLAAAPPLESRRKRRVAGQRKAKKSAIKKESGTVVRENTANSTVVPIGGTEKAEVTKDGAVVESRQRAKQPQRARSPPYQQMRREEATRASINRFAAARSIFYQDMMPGMSPYRTSPQPFYGYHHPPQPPRFPYEFSGMRPVALQPHEEAFLRFGPQGSRRAKERHDLVKQENEQAEIRNAFRKAQTVEELQKAIDKAMHLSMEYEVATATKQLGKLKSKV